MAVETKPTASSTMTGVPPAASGTLTGMPAIAAKPRKKRASSLLAVATSLPSVETSLEEFIARANQSDVDPSTWDNAERVAREQDEKRKEADALRWKAAEEQLRDGQQREVHLKNKLDGLQGQLAEAEARVAVALSSSNLSAAAIDGAAKSAELAELKQKLAAAEERAMSLSTALVAAKQESAKRAESTELLRRPTSFDDERVALAGATAAKTPWLAFAGAFVGGVAIMFVVGKLMNPPAAPPTVPAVAQPAPAQTQPQAAPPTPAPPPVQQAQPAPAKAEPAHPTVTPIDEAPAQAATGPTVQPIEPVEQPKPAPVAATIEKKAPVVHHAVRRAAPAPAPTTTAAASKGIVDPFADKADAPKPDAVKPEPAKKDAAKASDKGGIVDPF